jgi:quercetin dioxygenase-like cupin family protein
MFSSNHNSCFRSGRRPEPENLAGTDSVVARLRSVIGRAGVLALIASICVVTAGSAATGKKRERKPYTPPEIDAKALTTMLQHFDKVEKQEHPWGWIRWLMNDKLDRKSKMTFGVVEINAGQTNPLHVHPNCEELIYIISGSCEHRLGSQTVTLKTGDVLRIPRGVPHKAETSEKEPVQAVIVYSSGDRQFEVVEE